MHLKLCTFGKGFGLIYFVGSTTFLTSVHIILFFADFFGLLFFVTEKNLLLSLESMNLRVNHDSSEKP